MLNEKIIFQKNTFAHSWAHSKMKRKERVETVVLRCFDFPSAGDHGQACRAVLDSTAAKRGANPAFSRHISEVGLRGRRSALEYGHCVFLRYFVSIFNADVADCVHAFIYVCFLYDEAVSYAWFGRSSKQSQNLCRERIENASFSEPVCRTFFHIFNGLYRVYDDEQTVLNTVEKRKSRDGKLPIPAFIYAVS